MFEPAAVHDVAPINPIVNGASTRVAVAQSVETGGPSDEVDPLS